MDGNALLAERFEARRAQLYAVAYRVLGSASEADDAVQEAWLRVSRAGTGGVENLDGWLTTIVARVSLSMLRSRRARREDLTDAQPVPADGVVGPEDEALLADSVGLALLVVLDTLTPSERLAFVLHDLFDVPFDEIAAVIERSPAAARQIASRARRRVRGAGVSPAADPGRRQEIVDAFLAASRGGDFEALLAVLDPDIVLRADATAVRLGAPAEAFGARAVAGFFRGRAGGARPAVVDGTAAAVWAPGGRPLVVFTFTIAHGRISAIELVGDADRVRRFDLVLGGAGGTGSPLAAVKTTYL
jgi:RNA polymerase sigma-70 factor (ECF subfamily)